MDITQLKRIPFFQAFSEEELLSIASRLQFRRYPKGAVVFAEGEPGDAMYLIQYGQVRVVSDIATEKQVFAHLGPGAFFGEMALLSGEPRSAGIVVNMDAGLWVLSKEGFERLLAQQPSLALTFSRVLSQRLSESDRKAVQQAEQGPTLIALVGERAETLTTRLAEETGQHLALLDLMAPAAPRPEADSPASAAQHRPDYDYLAPSPAYAHDPEVLSREIAALADHYDRVVIRLPNHPDIVAMKAISLVQAALCFIPSDEAWVRQAAGDRFWPVRSSDDLEVARVARRLCRHTVGLALSAGSAHGLAHIGVLKVLEEARIPIDLIAGTSIGSLIGAIYAATGSLDRLFAFAEEAASRLTVRGGLFDFAVPFRHGLVQGERVLRYIRRLVESKSFVALRTPLYVVAAELGTGREIIFDSGPVAEAVRASISIPGLFVPFYHQGHWLVDGGSVNPVPCSVLSHRGANRIIGVHVAAEIEDRVRRGITAIGRGTGKGTPPSILEAFFGSLEAMQAEIAAAKAFPVDVLIRPRTGPYGTMEATKAKELIQAGEEAARQEIERIRELVRPGRRS